MAPVCEIATEAIAANRGFVYMERFIVGNPSSDQSFAIEYLSQGAILF
jgi:hypothetical protein